MATAKVREVGPGGRLYLSEEAKLQSTKKQAPNLNGQSRQIFTFHAG